MSVTVRDVYTDNFSDVFTVCSGAAPSGYMAEGVEIKRRWLAWVTEELGPISKVAYLDGKPVAQALFLPESAIPYEPNPRRGVVRLFCIYNSAPEARGKGAAGSLLASLIDDCTNGIRCLRGESCSFIASEPFNTGEGISLSGFYGSRGFKQGAAEMYLEVNGRYTEPARAAACPQKADQGMAIALFNPTCEYSYSSARKAIDFITEVAPGTPTRVVDQWSEPQESIMRGGRWLTVNCVPIKASIREKDKLKAEVLGALEA